MHLKSIEMVGFKSFADKTVVELKPGVSGIVGPNGCGKSNIVDALRWCLGEMSAKSLRSKQMLDVIFAGASGRAPMNMSEVTLTFDNSHGLLPIDFTEIQVTRRLFRSGESEYFLNRTQCRLKDIKDLFMDTGLHEGYSILAQGEVDFVMHAKPEERRQLFEEAAGITKYKTRREEALRKLEKVELDLNRLNDLISVIKDQMGSLEAAARKAKLFQKAKEELKNLEVTDALHKMISLDEQMAQAGKKMEELKAEHEKASTDLNSAEAALTQYRIDQDATEKELYENQLATLEFDKAINASDNAVRTEKEREKEFLETAQKLAEKIKILEASEVELQQKCDEARKEIETASEKVAALKEAYAAAKQNWETAKGGRTLIETKKNEISAAIFKITSEVSSAGNEKNSLSSLQIHKESELASSLRELTKAETEAVAIEAEIAEKNMSLAEISNGLAAAKEEALKAKSDLKAGEERRESLRHQTQSLRIALAHAQAQKKILDSKFQKDPYHKGTQSILNQSHPGLHGAVGILMKYPAHLAHWVESILGSKINYLVFERTDQARDALAWLKEHSLGRARCLILEKIPAIQVPDLSQMPNANSLLNFVQCAPELDSLKRYLFGQAFLAGNTLYDAGIIDGGSDLPQVEPVKDGEAVESFQNEFLALSNLEREIAANTDLLKNVERDFFGAEMDCENLKTALEEKTAQLGKHSLQEEHWKDIVAQKKEELDLSLREAAFLKDSQAQYQKDLADIHSKIETFTAIVRESNELLSQKETERTGLQSEIDASLTKEHELEVISKETEIRFETFHSDYEKREQSLRGWEEQLNRSVKERESSSAEIGDYHKKAEAALKRSSEEAENILKLQEEKNKTSQIIESLLKVKTEREEKNKVFLSEIQSTRERQTGLTETLHSMELDLRTLQSDKKNVLSRMEETYQLTLEQLEKEFKPEPADAEEIARLRKRVESMANSVNLEAPEQHQALSERFNFLNTQTQDLAKAREDLKSAIQQINGTTREQFKESFTKVRENFRKIYGTLFEGGVADLVFTDENNLLETGIDIVAQPPGKKLQNIALLSGGEKALTAISLLFAFFMVKPSPFCVLDEVDAPWDPANVGRFLNLVKEFTQRIQFLVVTHNPRTMEMADVLYGVTMQEFGISKVLSMKLRKDSPNTAVPVKEELTPA